MKQLKQEICNGLYRQSRPAGAEKGFRAKRYQYAEWKRCTVAPDDHGLEGL